MYTFNEYLDLPTAFVPFHPKKPTKSQKIYTLGRSMYIRMMKGGYLEVAFQLVQLAASWKEEIHRAFRESSSFAGSLLHTP